MSSGALSQGHTTVKSMTRITVLTLSVATTLTASGHCGQALNNPSLILYSKVQTAAALRPEMDSFISPQSCLSQSLELFPGF